MPVTGCHTLVRRGPDQLVTFCAGPWRAFPSPVPPTGVRAAPSSPQRTQADCPRECGHVRSGRSGEIRCGQAARRFASQRVPGSSDNRTGNRQACRAHSAAEKRACSGPILRSKSPPAPHPSSHLPSNCLCRGMGGVGFGSAFTSVMRRGHLNRFKDYCKAGAARLARAQQVIGRGADLQAEQGTNFSMPCLTLSGRRCPPISALSLGENVAGAIVER